jgi:hypothetical protein
VVALDQLAVAVDPVLGLVARVGLVGVRPVGVGHEHLPDLLLERHPVDLAHEAVAVVAVR